MANYFTDRVAQYPGRVTMEPVEGSTNTYDMIRAEGNVVEEGTPFNAATFNGIAQEILDQIPARAPFYYGTCETGQSSQNKTVTCTGFELTTGAAVAIRFTNGNAYNGTTYLNVDNTGNIPIRDNTGDASIAFGLWDSGAIMVFVYNGEAWQPMVSADQTNVMGSWTSIKSYGSSSNVFTCPGDGYARVVCSYRAASYARVNSADGQVLAQLSAPGNTTLQGLNVLSVPVFKGMRIYAEVGNDYCDVLYAPISKGW